MIGRDFSELACDVELVQFKEFRSVRGGVCLLMERVREAWVRWGEEEEVDKVVCGWGGEEEAPPRT